MCKFCRNTYYLSNIRTGRQRILMLDDEMHVYFCNANVTIRHFNVIGISMKLMLLAA